MNKLVTSNIYKNLAHKNGEISSLEGKHELFNKWSWELASQVEKKNTC